MSILIPCSLFRRVAGCVTRSMIIPALIINVNRSAHQAIGTFVQNIFFGVRITSFTDPGPSQHRFRWKVTLTAFAVPAFSSEAIATGILRLAAPCAILAARPFYQRMEGSSYDNQVSWFPSSEKLIYWYYTAWNTYDFIFRESYRFEYA